MAFPSPHRYPAELPVWLLAGHAFDAVGITDDAEMDAGEDLARQIYTWVPKIANVGTIVTQAQFDEFDRWYEQDILAGALPFDTLVATEGGPPNGTKSWWVAQFIAPYKWEAMHRGYYRVTAQLLLEGPFAETIVRTEPSLRARLAATTELVARVTSVESLRARIAATTLLSGWLGDPEGRITEEDEDRITEDGETRMLEA